MIPAPGLNKAGDAKPLRPHFSLERLHRRTGNRIRILLIPTKRLRLVLQSPAEVLARIEALSPAEQAEVSADWLARIRASTAVDPWMHGFSIVDKATGEDIGSCGYKGPPDSAQAVEIAYAVSPQYQHRGYATEAAQGLVDFAIASGQVRIVRAHTLHGNAASGRVLEKCGFVQVGDVVDPDDGLVLRWERTA